MTSPALGLVERQRVLHTPAMATFASVRSEFKGRKLDGTLTHIAAEHYKRDLGPDGFRASLAEYAAGVRASHPDKSVVVFTETIRPIANTLTGAFGCKVNGYEVIALPESLPAPLPDHD